MKSQAASRLDIRARLGVSRADGEAAEGLILKKKVVVGALQASRGKAPKPGAEGGDVVRSKKKELVCALQASRGGAPNFGENRAGIIVASTTTLSGLSGGRIIFQMSLASEFATIS